MLFLKLNTFLGRTEHDNDTQLSVASAIAAAVLISPPSKASYDGLKFQRRPDSHDGDDNLRQDKYPHLGACNVRNMPSFEWRAQADRRGGDGIE